LASYGNYGDPTTMATANLTKRILDTLKYSPDCDYFVWDTRLKGFGVRVTERADAEGKVHHRKMFVVGYRPRGGRQFRRLSLGMFGPVTVEQARAEALRQLSAISSGNDPVEAKRVQRAEQTVRELYPTYFEHVERHRKPSTTAEYKRMWEKHVLSAFGNKKVSAVTLADVRRFHRSLHKTPYHANRVVAMLGAFFTFASKEGARPLHDNPAHGVEFFPEQPRERFLTPDEFRRLGAALTRAESEGLPPAPEHRRKPPKEANAKHRPKNAGQPIPANPFGVAAIRLLALTGCRENEILSLTWDSVDLERGHLRLSNTKTGKSVRPLGQSAAAVLSGLPKIQGNPYVLPGGASGIHLKDIKRLWHAVRHAAKLSDVRIHDLRHSFASVPATSGESLLVVRSLLGHKRVATTERYAHLGDDPVKRAADRTSESIAAWLSASPAPGAPRTRSKATPR
jgi:integrase